MATGAATLAESFLADLDDLSDEEQAGVGAPQEPGDGDEVVSWSGRTVQGEELIEWRPGMWGRLSLACLPGIVMFL